MDMAMNSMEEIVESQRPRHITMEEVLNIVIKLKPNKAKDLQNWKNSTMIEGGDEMLLSI